MFFIMGYLLWYNIQEIPIIDKIRRSSNLNIEAIYDLIRKQFKSVAGIDAIVLGGSRSTNTATEHSDIDIGIYYNDDFDIETFKTIGTSLDDTHRLHCITDIGAWGPWINGGGWLTINNVAVDILFRETKKVKRCMDDCNSGDITIDYQCGHPFGFINSIYVGELYYCKILSAPSNTIIQMKETLSSFSPVFKKAMIDRFLWEAEFSQNCGRKGLEKGDITYVSGSIYRTIQSLVQVLYSENELYCLNEKGSIHRLTKSGKRIPADFIETIETSTSLTKDNMFEIMTALDNLLDTVKNWVS